MALLTRLLTLTWLTRNGAAAWATPGPLAGDPVEYRTTDGLFYRTADGIYYGVAN